MSATGHPSHSGSPAPTTGDTHTPPGGAHTEAEAGAAKKIVPIDERVASDFLTWPRHQPPELSKSPRLVGLLYGLLCVDIDGREVLLPNPGAAHHTLHLARIWFMTSCIGRGDAGQVPDNATGTDETTAFTYFDIARSSVVFKAIDAKGNELPDSSTPLKKRDNPYHPWIDFKWIRCLKKLTGLPLIGKAQRNNPALVSSRVWLGTGKVSAFPPFSRDGQHGQWKVKQRNGKTVVSATTDSMLWGRPLSKKTAKVRMTVTPLGSESGWYVDLTPQKGKVLLCAVTHALFPSGRRQSGQKLIHSRIFAKILKKDRARFPFPIPEIVSLPRPYGVESTDDVHCECACP